MATPKKPEDENRAAGKSRPCTGAGTIQVTARLRDRVVVTARKHAFGHDMFLCQIDGFPEGGEDWLRGTTITWTEGPTD